MSIFYILLVGIILAIASTKIPTKKKEKKVKDNPRYLDYEPVFELDETCPMEKLVKAVRDSTINYLHTFGYSWANEVTVWTDSIFTTQLERELTDTFTKIKNNDENIKVDVNPKDSAKEIIRHYQTKVFEKYPELKGY